MSGIDFSDPRFWLDLVQVAAIVMLWLRKPGEDASVRITSVEAEVKVIKERISHFPNNEELAELEGSLKAVLAQFDGLRDTVVNVRTAVQRIEDFLRSSSR